MSVVYGPLSLSYRKEEAARQEAARKAEAEAAAAAQAFAIFAKALQDHERNLESKLNEIKTLVNEADRRTKSLTVLKQSSNPTLRDKATAAADIVSKILSNGVYKRIIGTQLPSRISLDMDIDALAYGNYMNYMVRIQPVA